MSPVKPSDPTGHTQDRVRQAARSLPMSDTTDFTDADRGFLAEPKPGVVKDADGNVVWDNDSFSYIQGSCPNSVNPSLWRQAQLMIKQGYTGIEIAEMLQMPPAMENTWHTHGYYGSSAMT